MCYSCAIHVLFTCYSCAILHCNGCWRRHIYISWTMKNYSVAPQTKDHCVRFVAKESPSAVACPEWSCTRGARQGIAGSSSGVGRVMLPFPEKIDKWNKRGKTQLQKTKETLCVAMLLMRLAPFSKPYLPKICQGCQGNSTFSYISAHQLLTLELKTATTIQANGRSKSVKLCT